MAMLAEPRRKQKWTLNPRGKHWSEDSNKFGQKMLEKMGWSSGKGLGANLDGMTDHIRARYKNDQAGIGFSNDDMDKQWTQHQEGYNELLQKLQNSNSADTSLNETELSGKSLELKSKHSRARVHYQKFTRGKDVNKYSTKDLANIFGKKDLEEKSDAPISVENETKAEVEEFITEPIGSSDTSHGIVTIKGGSITDYFKNKISSLGRKSINNENRGSKNESESEDEKYPGFDYVSSRIKTEKSSKMKSNVGENEDLENVNSIEKKITPGKRKCDYIFENPALEIGDNSGECERTPKRRKNDFAFENNGLNLDSPKDSTKTQMVENNIELQESNLQNCEFIDSSNKKKRKKKSKELCNAAGGFTNEALNLEIPENDVNNSRITEFEIPRCNFGLSNDALDLTDESNGKKRVTFNETVEYDTNAGKVGGKKKKKKMAGKLDKFEIDNEKLKKKKKADKKRSPVEIITIDGGFLNEAMEPEVISQEAEDNAVNERKMDKVKKKRRMSSLETIAEAPEEETVEEPEVVTLDESLIEEGLNNNGDSILEIKQKKKKKRKKDKKDEGMIEGVELIEEVLSTQNGNEKPSKKEPQVKETIVIVDVHDNGKKTRKSKENSSKPEVIIEEIEESIEESIEFFDGTGEDKRKKRKKSKYKSSDITANENIEVVFEHTEMSERKKKLKKPNCEEKKRSLKENENEDLEENKGISSSEKLPKNQPELIDETVEIQEDKGTKNFLEESTFGSPWENKGNKKSKSNFKSLFARSPIVLFPGSNLNEIKGYGVE